MSGRTDTQVFVNDAAEVISAATDGPIGDRLRMVRGAPRWRAGAAMTGRTVFPAFPTRRIVCPHCFAPFSGAVQFDQHVRYRCTALVSRRNREGGAA